MNLDWRVAPFAELAGLITDRVGGAHPAVIAVDGHSSSGKTTLAGRLATALPDAAVLHTDDLAWWQGVFTWDVLLREDVLPLVRAGRPLDYRPPQWQAREREGSITLPGSLAYLVVEGVGAGQLSVRDAYEVVLWVETDEPTRLDRDRVRLAEGEMSAGGFERWMAEENAYTTHQRPWEQADLLVYGGESIPYDRATEIVLSRPVGRPR